MEVHFRYENGLQTAVSLSCCTVGDELEESLYRHIWSHSPSTVFSIVFDAPLLSQENVPLTISTLFDSASGFSDELDRRDTYTLRRRQGRSMVVKSLEAKVSYETTAHSSCSTWRGV